MYQYHIVGYLLDIRYDMRGKEDGTLLVLNKTEEHIEYLIPYHGVEPRRGLVEYQKLWIVRHGTYDGQLHLHPL